MTGIRSLEKIDDESSIILESVGIKTDEDFYSAGVVETYRRVKAAYPETVTLHWLYALHCAYVGCDLDEITPEAKKRLRQMVGVEANETTLQQRKTLRKKRARPRSAVRV